MPKSAPTPAGAYCKRITPPTESTACPSHATKDDDWAPATENPILSARRRYSGLNTGLVATFLMSIGVAGCASTPLAPTPEMTRAEVAIDQAQKAGAADLDNANLQAAQTRLADAKVAAGKGDAKRSQDLVAESMADAQLADLTAQSIKSAKAAAEVDKNITTLQSESDRRESL